MVYLYTYLIVVIFVSLRLGFYLCSTLDYYDWRYDKKDYLSAFLLFSILWPLFLLKPKYFVTPSELFTIEYSVANTQRECDLFLKHPPSCGSVIRFYTNNDGSYGCFEFYAADVEAALYNSSQASTHQMNDEEGALLKWVMTRDESFNEVVDIPEVLTGFEHIADGLIRSGNVKRAYCSMCRRMIDNNELKYKDDHGRAGWNANRIFCPEQHRLLAVETVHFFMG
ncbi:hypothetical protein [Neptuniibacter pectenicola]|jgi:hypothetical protein|uniref:hypothetical protein n=1 Tax=Neptuniibacter pectenicola TaxID=1806669 RepID=UPI0030EF3BF9